MNNIPFHAAVIDTLDQAIVDLRVAAAVEAELATNDYAKWLEIPTFLRVRRPEVLEELDARRRYAVWHFATLHSHPGAFITGEVHAGPDGHPIILLRVGEA